MHTSVGGFQFQLKLHFIECLFDIGDQIFGRFDAAGEADEVRADAGGSELFVVHLAVGGAGRMQATAACIGDVGLDGGDLQVLHEFFGRGSAALDAEADDAAGAVGQIFLREVVVLIAFQTRVGDPADALVGGERLGDGQTVFAVALHAHVQALETEVQEKRALRRLDGTEVTHELRGGLGDVGAFQAEAFGIGHAVVAFVGRAEAGKFFGVLRPVELAGVDDAAADRAAVAVHVLRRRVGDDIGAPFKRATVDRGGESVVDDQRHAVGVGRFGKFLDIENGEGGVGDRFAENGFGLGTEGRVEFFLGAVGRNEGEVDAHALHRNGKEVIGAAVDRRRGHDVVAGGGDVEHGKEAGRLTRRGQHGRRAAFEFADLGRDGIAGGVLQAGIEIAAGFQVKQLAHIAAGSVFEGRALDDRDLTRFAVAGRIATLDAFGFDIQIAQGADVLNTALISNDYDMIIAPLNLGAKLYLAGKSNYILDSVITTNNTYLVSKNPISSTNDLAGLNLLAYGQNSTPDIILRAALTKHNVTANIGYKGNVGDVLNLFMGGSDEATYSLLAEPQVTIVKKNNPNVYVLDMAKEVEVGKVFPQACLYVKADTKDKYNEHLKLIEENIKYLNENPSEYAAKVEDKHQYFTTMTKEVLTAALPNCNILYLKGNSNKNAVEDYIALLNTYAPALLGGKTVDEGFYN